jgi:hypothetical protein
MLTNRKGTWTPRLSLRGYPYAAWSPPMPRIPDIFQESSIYLYPSVSDAERGERAGGSGFFYAIPSTTVDGALHIFAVTNAHVIEGGSCTIRLNTHDGKFDALEFDESNWLVHPAGDDVAICVMPALDLSRLKFRVLDSKHMLTREVCTSANVGTGDEVFIIGRFVNSEGKLKNTPVVRFGNISQMPIEPMEQRRNWGIHKQESFLVEARAISGFSGSPVMLMLMAMFNRQGGTMPKSEHQDIFRLLGISWGYVKDWERVCDSRGEPLAGGSMVPINTGMMGVVPAWKIQEMFDMPIIKDHLKNQDEAAAKALKPAVSGLASAAPHATGENPSHLEDFRRLVSLAARKPESKD